MSYKEAQRHYGIQDRSTVLVWLRKHGRQDWSQGVSVRVPGSRPATEPTLPLTPEQRIKELEKQLALSHQTAQFFEAAVNLRCFHYKKATRQFLSQGQNQDLSITRVCLFMGISRQAYYKRNRAYDARAVEGQQVLVFVLEKRRRQPRLGIRKLHYLLGFEAQTPFQEGRDRLVSILREARQLVPRKQAYHKTTHGHRRDGHVYEGLSKALGELCGSHSQNLGNTPMNNLASNYGAGTTWRDVKGFARRQGDGTV